MSSSDHGQLAHNNVDDRGEMLRLLQQLAPAEQVDFLRWCCARSVIDGGRIRMYPSTVMQRWAEQAERKAEMAQVLSGEVFKDVWFLAKHGQLDMVAALAYLEQRVKRKSHGHRHV